MGPSVGLLDCDINAPDIPHMLGVHLAEAPKGLGLALSSGRVRRPSGLSTPTTGTASRRPRARLNLATPQVSGFR